MGSSGSGTGLTPVKPNSQVTTVMGKPVTGSQTIQGIEGFDAKKWEKALKSGKPVTSEDAMKSQVSMPSFGFSPSSPEQYQNYGFAPQQTMMPDGTSPFASPTNSALWGDDNDKAAVEQFLEWQKRMGY